MRQPVLMPGLPPETVRVLEDKESGLEGVIVLHSTRLGPAAGGTRLWRYSDKGAATLDALRLAEGMSYKNALADLPLGGGKAVIKAPEKPFDRRKLFEAFGREVAKLKGLYVTAEDVGTAVSDMQVVREHTPHVAGLVPQPGQPGGDPSPFTALGVFVSMQEAVRRKYGVDLRGLTVAVQGLGNVGMALCELLHNAGAKLVVSELRPGIALATADRFGAKAADTDSILKVECEVLAPCALGAVLDDEVASTLKARVICGGANNLLATTSAGNVLHERGVLYCPDYVVNAGGIINVCAEYLGWTQDEVNARVNATGERLTSLLNYSDAVGLAPHLAADELARAKVMGREPLQLMAACERWQEFS